MKASSRASVGWRSPTIIGEWIAVAVAACGLVILLTWSGATTSADRLIYDHLIQARHGGPSDRILLVAVDDEALRRVGAWPWTRATHARLIDRLAAARPAAIGYDVMFLEPQPDDPALAKAFAGSRRAILPVAALAPGRNGRAVTLLEPVAVLKSAAVSLGHVELAPDSDGVVRRASQVAASDGGCWRALSLALVDAATKASPARDPACPAMLALSHAVGGGLVVKPPRPIAFAGPPGAFRTISAGAVLADEVPPEFIRGKYVLVGATALGLGDRHVVAASGAQGPMAGVEIQANVLDAELQGRVVREPAGAWLLLIAVAPVALLLMVLPFLGPSSGLMAAGASIAIVAALFTALFFVAVWIPPLSTAAGLAVAYPLWSWRRLAAASPALAGEIKRLPKPAMVGAQPPMQEVFGRQLDAMSRAAELLRGFNRRMEETLQSLPDATVAVDARGVIIFANRHAEALTAAHSGAPLGTSLAAWLGLQFPPEDLEQALTRLSTGETPPHLRTRQGAEYAAAQVEMRSADGALESVIFRLHDISLVKSAARQREEVIQLLTHDLRAPLASILAVLTPQRELEPRDGARISAYAKRGLALAEGYVQFARAESKALAVEPLDLAELAIEAADELWPQASAKAVTVQAGSADPTWIEGDRSLVSRALINLLDNALKVSVAGGKVSIHVEQAERLAVCTIDDEGPGLPAGAAAHLFQPFQAGLGGAASSGVGLGLAIVQMVMQRHGGQARHVPSERGARFVLEFPLLKLDAAAGDEEDTDVEAATSIAMT